MISSICCESPVILRNPHLRELILQHGSYYLGGELFTITPSVRANYTHAFPYSSFSPFKNGVTVENYKDYYILNQSTGELYDMYILVPCGKCECCKHRKSREWSFRAICESQSSTNIPYFVTLTYDNAHLPDNGVEKLDVQLFLKRLRRNLDRLNIQHSIRYFCCAEYGSNTHRPHYHLLLWSFPHLDTFKHEIDLIEKSWQNGFVLVKPCNYGSIGYCMKYMSKDQYIPIGSNPGFFLSSRRGGGIGASIADSLADFYHSNPDKLDIEIVDKWSGERFKSFIPSYFVRKWFPTMSLLVPKSVRDAYKSFLYCLDVRKYLIDYRSYNIDTSDSDEELRLQSVYSFLPSYRSDIPPTYITNVIAKLDTCPFGHETLADYYHENSVLLADSMRVLSTYNPAPDYIEWILLQKRFRNSALNIRFSDAEEYDIDAIVYELKKQKNLSKKREVL